MRKQSSSFYFVTICVPNTVHKIKLIFPTTTTQTFETSVDSVELLAIMVQGMPHNRQHIFLEIRFVKLVENLVPKQIVVLAGSDFVILGNGNVTQG